MFNITKTTYYLCDECQTQRGYSKADYVENEGFIGYHQCDRCGYTLCLDCLYDHNQYHLKEVK